MLSDFAYGQIIKKKLVIMLFVFIPLENGTDPKDNKKIGTKKTDVSLALLLFFFFLLFFEKQADGCAGINGF